MEIPKSEVALRQSKVRAQMAAEGVDIVVAGASARMDSRGILRYLAGYYLPVFEEYLVIPSNGPVTFFAHDECGARYAKTYGAVDDVRYIPGDEYNLDPGKCIADFALKFSPETIGLIGGAGYSANFSQSIQNHLKCRFIDFTDSFNRIKMVKSAAEILQTEAAVRLNEDTFHHYLQFVRPGARELDAIAAASSFAMRNGAEDLYWMASSGEIPYLAYLAESWREDHLFRGGDYHYIVLEHSAAGGHYGETTHLVSLGKPKKEYARAFAAVCDAQKAAASRIKPGAKAGELADAAEEVLIDAGYMGPRPAEERATAIGHSQGTDVWEFPRIVHGDETTIVPGMRFNLHPAIVLQDGAKITSCDCYISTESGSRRLSSLPYEILRV